MILLNIIYLIIGIALICIGFYVVINISYIGLVSELIGVFYTADAILNFKKL